MSEEPDENLEDCDKRVAGNGLRATAAPVRKPTPHDPGLTELLDDMKRLDDDAKSPEAA